MTKKNSSFTEVKIMQALDYVYEKAITGALGTDSCYDLAEEYLKLEGDMISKTNSLIRWQNTKASTTGFLTGLGGVILLPVAIPANISTIWYVQIRMIASIAVMGGYDVKDDRVKSLVYACLTGNAAKDILKNIGENFSTKMTNQLIKSISGETIKAINKAVGFRLLTKFGEKGIVNLGKMVPLAGGVVGATFDGVTTNIIGNIARKTFIEGSALNIMDDN
ncbi:EcsC family protein [Atlantibacter hermannii]|uniref:EcsC family protein n=1 Tax=Atlantibacter hermannii TaxID=565 RepID=UPI0028A71DA0|nr:EcsC family protein [Atlantibacter hermannii]